MRPQRLSALGTAALFFAAPPFASVLQALDNQAAYRTRDNPPGRKILRLPTDLLRKIASLTVSPAVVVAVSKFAPERAAAV